MQLRWSMLVVLSSSVKMTSCNVSVLILSLIAANYQNLEN